jgi:hypothetical protein
MAIPGSVRLLFSIAALAVAMPLFAQIQFEDVSGVSGVDQVMTETWGASWGDFDGDGRPDIFVNNHRNGPSLFQNFGNDLFTDVALGTDITGTWLQNPFADQHAAAWADFDNDGDQDVYITGNDGWLFENVPAGLHHRPGMIPIPSFSGNSSLWFDHNNDGLLDLKSPGWHRGTRTNTQLLEQQSPGQFIELATSSGIGEDCGTLGGLSNAIANELRAGYIADINDDGSAEFMCLLKSGSFAEGGIAYTYGDGEADRLTGVPSSDKVRDAVIADFDGDLKQDIFFVNGTMRPSDAHQPDANTVESLLAVTADNQKVLHIQGSGEVTFDISWNVGDTWRKFTPERYIYIGAGGYQPASTLFTLDSADEANWGVRSFNPARDNIMVIGYDTTLGEWQIIQPGGGRTQQAYFIIYSDSGLTLAGLDTNITADGPVMPSLYMNQDPGFNEEAAIRGFDKELCVTVVAGDFDNDMDQDIILGCRGGSQNIANVVYENLGNGIFTKLADPGAVVGIIGSAVSAGAGTTESLVTADYDVDGFLDVFATNGLNLQPKGFGGPLQLFRNVGNSNHWLEFDFAGTLSNRDGVGAKIYVTTADGTVQLREQNGGYHRWSQNHMRLHFGLATHTAADIEVRWPSGTVDYFTNVTADNVYVINEGGSLDALTLGTPRPYKCSQPAYASSVDHAFIVWKNCYNGTWYIRGVGGGIDTVYTGTVEVSGGTVSNISETSIDADDLVDLSNGVLSFTFHSGKNGQDGLNFYVPSNADVCLSVSSDNPAPLLLGVDKNEYLTEFDLNTLGECRSGGNYFSALFVDSDSSVTSLATSDALIASGGIANTTLPLSVVDLTKGDRAGNFSQEQSFPYQDTFVAQITGEFEIDTAGIHTFGTNSDDGVRLRVNGIDVIVDDTLHDAEDRFGSIDLTAGIHSFELTFFHNLGSAALELFAAAGTHTDFSGVFNLLEPPSVPDTDGDGFNDNDDDFPADPNEWTDTDGDGVGDNGDIFPLDPTESADTDGDGFGDNADVFPEDPDEWIDTDGDGIGDNSDPYPDDPYNDPSESCGEPVFDKNSELGTFLWEDCDGSGMWHLRVTGGGLPMVTSYDGVIESTGGLISLTEYSIEPSDILDTVSNPDELAYVLIAYNTGIDGFDFVPAVDACFIPGGSGLPVYLGDSRTVLLTADLELDDLGACTELQCHP